MDFSKTHVLKSKTYPGVEVTLSRIGPRMRASLELSLTQARSTERDLLMKRDFCEETLKASLVHAPRDEEGKVIEAQLPKETLAAADALMAVRSEVENVQRALIYPAFVKAGVKNFNSELTYEGQPATAELLCEHGPDDLFLEVVAAINRNGYLTTEQVENLEQPCTSPAAVDGTTSSTNAESASSALDSQSKEAV